MREGQIGGRIRGGASRRADSFQAGHASSILVTRSRASLLVNAGFNVPKLFEYGDDKKNQAGHLYFMIIFLSWIVVR